MISKKNTLAGVAAAACSFSDEGRGHEARASRPSIPKIPPAGHGQARIFGGDGWKGTTLRRPSGQASRAPTRGEGEGLERRFIAVRSLRAGCKGKTKRNNAGGPKGGLVLRKTTCACAYGAAAVADREGEDDLVAMKHCSVHKDVPKSVMCSGPTIGRLYRTKVLLSRCAESKA